MQSPLKENELGISIILIPHNNAERFTTRMQRDVLPTVRAHPLWKFQVIFIDNSDEHNKQQYNFSEDTNVEYEYVWPGNNIMYGPAMNIAVSMCRHPYFVYICSNHGRMYDASWIDDLINPLINNPNIAMTGSLYGSCEPSVMGFADNLPHIHIQGGIFGARTEAIALHPYTDDERWKHWGSDIYQSYTLMAAGYILHPVETINSVWRQCLPSPEQWKYVHDYSE